MDLDTIVAWAKRRWFTYPGSTIYGGLANAWDFGPYGIELKRNIQNIWWKEFVQKKLNIIGLDAQILMNPKVWEASGHVWWFSDPLIDCKKCKNRFRADKLIEDYMEKNQDKEFPNNWAAEKTPSDDVLEYLERKNIKCPSCGALDYSDVKQFNLMFKTKQWVLEDKSSDIYLRPETAQGIFVNFKNITDSTRMRVPFGIAQIGKAFRNEISPWNFIFRQREFEQMEIEYFVEPGKDNEAMDMWIKDSWNWRTKKIGIKEENLRKREHSKDELSHYSKGTIDIEYNFPWGWGELSAAGANRTDYDLKQHQEHSGVNMQYTDPKTGQRYIPYVIEPSFGLTRAILTAMIDAYDEEKYTDPQWREQTRVVARFHPNVAPIKFAILPLMEKKTEIMEMAQEIFEKLSDKYMCEFDSRWNIGKRYRRQDEIGTPYCITVDYDSLEDGTVTIRDRDTMEQKRIKVEEISL